MNYSTLTLKSVQLAQKLVSFDPNCTERKPNQQHTSEQKAKGSQNEQDQLQLRESYTDTVTDPSQKPGRYKDGRRKVEAY